MSTSLIAEEISLAKTWVSDERLVDLAHGGQALAEEIAGMADELRARRPLPSKHPADALKEFGMPMTAEAEAHARAICDQLICATCHQPVGWQPIVTAPKDGTEVIVGVDIATVWVTRGAWYRSAEEVKRIESLGWDADDVGWWSYKHSITQEKLEGIYEPTHWLPMPEPPENSGTGDT